MCKLRKRCRIKNKGRSDNVKEHDCRNWKIQIQYFRQFPEIIYIFERFERTVSKKFQVKNYKLKINLWSMWPEKFQRGVLHYIRYLLALPSSNVLWRAFGSKFQNVCPTQLLYLGWRLLTRSHCTCLRREKQLSQVWRLVRPGLWKVFHHVINKGHKILPRIQKSVNIHENIGIIFITFKNRSGFFESS